MAFGREDPGRRTAWCEPRVCDLQRVCGRWRRTSGARGAARPGAGSGEARDALVLDEGQHLACLEALAPHRCRPGGDAREEAHSQAADPEQHLARVRAITGPVLHALGEVPSAEAGGVVEMRDTLGIGSRPRRVDHQSRIGRDDIVLDRVEQRIVDLRRDIVVVRRRDPRRRTVGITRELDPAQARSGRQCEWSACAVRETGIGEVSRSTWSTPTTCRVVRIAARSPYRMSRSNSRPGANVEIGTAIAPIRLTARNDSRKSGLFPNDTPTCMPFATPRPRSRRASERDRWSRSVKVSRMPAPTTASASPNSADAFVTNSRSCLPRSAAPC